MPSAEQRAHPERDAPADVEREDRLLQEDQREQAADDGAEPERAVDDQVDPAAGAGGDHLVDRRVDRRVLAADAGAGEEPRDQEPQRAARENAVATVASR